MKLRCGTAVREVLKQEGFASLPADWTRAQAAQRTSQAYISRVADSAVLGETLVDGGHVPCSGVLR
jgi:hypothetical protein